MNGKVILLAAAAAVAAAAQAQYVRRSAGASVRTGRGAAAAAAAQDDERQFKEGRVVIEQFPKLGRASTLEAPSIQGGSSLPVCFTKPRRWIVAEAKYRTESKWTDQLTFTWHILLETKSATEKDKDDRGKIPPYSYFSQSVTYMNIPRGGHAASVCLPPSYLERFGEPKAIGLVITSPTGQMLAGDSESGIENVKSHSKWWENNAIMDAKQPGSQEPMIERRQGLLDRSKTIWALVKPNDYETVAQ